MILMLRKSVLSQIVADSKSFQESVGQDVTQTCSSPSSWLLMPLIMVMVLMLRKLLLQKERSCPALLAATQPLKALTKARWSLEPPAPSAKLRRLWIDALRAPDSTGNTQGSLHTQHVGCEICPTVSSEETDQIATPIG